MTDIGNPLRRRALIFLDGDQIARMLDLPDGYTVMGVNSDWQRIGITVMVQHDELRPVDPACEPPMLDGGWWYDGETGRLRFAAGPPDRCVYCAAGPQAVCPIHPPAVEVQHHEPYRTACCPEFTETGTSHTEACCERSEAEARA